MADTIDALNRYGTKHVSGITVGNEYILNAPAAGKVAAVAFLVAKMRTVRLAPLSILSDRHNLCLDVRLIMYEYDSSERC